MQDKETIRKEFIQIRDSMDKKLVLELSLEIKKRLFSMQEFMDANHIMFYVSKGNEVFTHDMVKEQLKGKDDTDGKKIISVPVSTEPKIIPSTIESFDELKPGAFDILEPTEIRKAKLSEIELVIVPGVAFDLKGNRLGHGFGYYDKFLKTLKCTKVALAFESQLAGKFYLPINELDVPVDFIVTEKRIIKCIR